MLDMLDPEKSLWYVSCPKMKSSKEDLLSTHILKFPPLVSDRGKTRGGENLGHFLTSKIFRLRRAKNLIFERFRQSYDYDFSCVNFLLKDWLQKRRRRKKIGDRPSKNTFLLPENTFLKGFQYIKHLQIPNFFRLAAGSRFPPPCFRSGKNKGGGGEPKDMSWWLMFMKNKTRYRSVKIKFPPVTKKDRPRILRFL